MVVTRTLTRLECEEEEEAIQIAQALALSEQQQLPAGTEELCILNEEDMQSHASDDVLADPQCLKGNRRFLERLRELATRHIEAHNTEIRRLMATRERDREADRKTRIWQELNIAVQHPSYIEAMHQTHAQLERYTELSYLEGVARSRMTAYANALSEVTELTSQISLYLPAFKILGRHQERLKQFVSESEGELMRILHDLHQAEGLYHAAWSRQDWVARRHPGMLTLPLTSPYMPARLNPFLPATPTVAQFSDDEEETKD
ncbi:unnamed protein product [Aphanomyces euteiches]